MDVVSNVSSNQYYGATVVFLLIILLFLQLVDFAGFEGMHGSYYSALGGPPGASGALSDHTGWGGDQAWQSLATGEGFHSPNRRIINHPGAFFDKFWRILF